MSSNGEKVEKVAPKEKYASHRLCDLCLSKLVYMNFNVSPCRLAPMSFAAATAAGTKEKEVRILNPKRISSLAIFMFVLGRRSCCCRTISCVISTC